MPEEPSDNSSEVKLDTTEVVTHEQRAQSVKLVITKFSAKHMQSLSFSKMDGIRTADFWMSTRSI